MTLKNTADRWGPVSQLLHWLIVALMFVLQPSTRDKAVVFVCEHGAA